MDNTTNEHKSSYIEQLSNGRWRVYSKKGKNLGTYSSSKAAKKRLAQVELWFRGYRWNRKARTNLFSNLIKSGKKDPVTYSSMMRNLRANKPEIVKEFMEIFKNTFDVAMNDNLEDAEQIALLEAMQKLKLTSEV